MPTAHLDLRPVTGHIGAEVAGVDLARPLSEETVAVLRGALLRWKVLFFRGQRLDVDGQRRFAEHFGPLTAAHPTVPGLPEHREVLDVDARHGTPAVHWHTDVSFVDRPPLGSVLRAVVVPPHAGDTLWANTALAYEELPHPLQRLAESLQAVHTNRFDYAGPPEQASETERRYAAVFQATRFETVHPVVRVHPETCERALFLGGFARRLVDLSERESTALLRLFRAEIERHENLVRWRWREGDVVFWDNRTTQHRVVADFGDQPRRLHRVTVAGDVPVGVDGRTSKALRGDSEAYSAAA
jgi:taurine dioxygenase